MVSNRKKIPTDQKSNIMNSSILRIQLSWMKKKNMRLLSREENPNESKHLISFQRLHYSTPLKASLNGHYTINTTIQVFI